MKFQDKILAQPLLQLLKQLTLNNYSVMLDNIFHAMEHLQPEDMQKETMIGGRS